MKVRLPLLVLLGVAFLGAGISLYRPALRGPFVSDDLHYVSQNAHVQELSLENLAVLFDPPGQASEKQTGNDHFIDGVRCYLVGETSSRYFVADALRCID